MKEKKVLIVGGGEQPTIPTEKMPEYSVTPEQKFLNSMKDDNIPEENKGKNQYVFHRDTGAMLVSFKEIYTNRKKVFEVWAKDPKEALELFKKRIKWNKYKKDQKPQAEIDWPERFK